MKSIFKLGEYQKLEAVKEVPMGMYLSLPDTMRRSDEAKELVLLPKREMPKDLQVNDLITVFIYKDSEDRPVATSLKPSVTLGEFAYLPVVQTTDIGAFLNWGLLKDLFLPFKEQTYRGRCLVAYKDHVNDLNELSDEDRNAFMADVARVTRAMDKAFHPEKINYGAYSDKLSHLHFHLASKYVDGPDYGGTFQMNPGKVYLTDAEYQELIEAIKEKL